MSDFDVKTISTATLIWALSDRGIDVDDLVEQVSLPPKRQVAAGDPKIISLASRRKH